jgi:hypothetical protein
VHSTQNKKPRISRGFLFQYLFLNVRQKRHEAGALYRCLDSALLLGGKTTSLSTQDASVRIDELLQEVDVFVIDVLDIVLRKNVV